MTEAPGPETPGPRSGPTPAPSVQDPAGSSSGTPSASPAQVLRAPRRAGRPVRVVWVLLGIYVAIALVQAGLDALGVDAPGGEAGFERWVFGTFAHDRQAVWRGELWRPVTATFLHAGLLHLALNGFALVYVGRVVERWLGAKHFLWIYALGAVAGSIFFQADPGFVPGVGASGAVFAVFGAFCAGIFARPGPKGPVLSRRFWAFLAVAVALIFAEGFLGELLYRSIGQGGYGVAVSAHLGGFVAGLFLGWLACIPRLPSFARKRRRAWLGLAAILLAVGAHGFVWPVLDWSWHVWSAGRALARGRPAVAAHHEERAWALGGDVARAETIRVEAERGDLERALALWDSLSREDFELKDRVGYAVLYDVLFARGRYEEADSVLADLIRLVDEELEEHRNATLLNTAAWYRAKARTDLRTALSYAREAARREPEGAIFNTLGWVQYLLDQYDEALENLQRAAELQPVGPNFLYLALALRDTDEDAARRLLARAGRSGFLQRHERRLLEEARASLHSG